MPDLLLDTRPPEHRSRNDLSALLRWSARLRTRVWDLPEFRLIVTWPHPDNLWEPLAHPNGTVCGVVGFLALDEQAWAAAEKESLPGIEGGLAARAVWLRYWQQGLRGWDSLSGNCVVVLYDPASATLHLRTDPAGCFPVFGCDVNGHPVWGSHPDVLAAAVDRMHALDQVSLADFIQSSTVTPPWTYYRGIEGCEPGTVLSLDLRSRQLASRRYFLMAFEPADQAHPDALAEVMTSAWRTAVRRRSLSRFGRVAVALSGGLDSRLVLASMEEPSRAVTFTCHDAPNRELTTARAIARAVGAEFHPIARPFDYYGENAPLGVRIAGGMGTFANNHFLGVLEPVQQSGAGMLLTGCYCDYLFKGLPLNRQSRWWDGHEALDSFREEFYFQHWHFETPLARQACQRWQHTFPKYLRESDNDHALFRIEALRTFPLYHEGDNQQRLVPQRLISWSPPVTDLEVLRVYRTVPSRLKLNRDIFLRMARRLLAGSPLLHVPDANTGAPLTAPAWQQALSGQWLRLQRRVRALRPSLASDGSWPNWRYYYRHSPTLEKLWVEPAPEVEEFFRQVTGWRTLPRRPADFPPDQCFLFVALLTLKLWWRHRPCFAA